MVKERLQKVIAHAGVASRRAAEGLILAGKVKVNGQVVTELGTKVDGNDEVMVNGEPVEQEQHGYYLLDKPRGVISSAHDDKGRKTVVDILKNEGVQTRVYPVGRLDYDTTGLLVMTNDGELANRLMHPRFEVDKVYIAKVKGLVSNDEMRLLREGVKIDGKKSQPARTKLLEANQRQKTSVVKLTIHEGHYHQVKKMMEAVSHPVLKLHRESYGPLTLAGLNPGQFRKLKVDEVRALRKLY